MCPGFATYNLELQHIFQHVQKTLPCTAPRDSCSGNVQQVARGFLGKKGGNNPHPEGNLTRRLKAAAEAIESAIQGLQKQKPGMKAIPQKMIGQLQSVSENLRNLAKGANDGYGYDIDMVHQRLNFALVNGIKWARNGFK